MGLLIRLCYQNYYICIVIEVYAESMLERSVCKRARTFEKDDVFVHLALAYMPWKGRHHQLCCLSRLTCILFFVMFSRFFFCASFSENVSFKVSGIIDPSMDRRECLCGA